MAGWSLNTSKSKTNQQSDISKQKIKPTKHITLEQLRPGMCCWPIGEPGTEDFHFCGRPVFDDKPYCADHCAIAYVKPNKHKDARAA